MCIIVGKAILSIPLNNLTHVVLTDDYLKFDEILSKTIPAGLILVNGSGYATSKFCRGIQEGQPIFIFKYTGSTSDLAGECLLKVDKLLQQRRHNPGARPELPFPAEYPGYYTHPNFLWPFSAEDIAVCRRLNILIENFPDRYNPASVLQIDMFTTSEERLQDQLTKTMSVVFEGASELGGQSSESRRLTYAWRLRYLMKYNARRYRFISDVLQILIIFFAFTSTVSAVLFNFFNIFDIGGPLYQSIFNKLTFILPLVNTLFTGIFAALNPAVKAGVLDHSAIKIESEIYMYRTKVGSYSMRAHGSSSKKDDKKKDKGKEEKKKTSSSTNPRKVFSAALEVIWTDLSSSDISKGAMINPSQHDDPLRDVNEKIKNNLGAQALLIDALKQPLKKKNHKSYNSQPFNSVGGMCSSLWSCCFGSKKSPKVAIDDFLQSDLLATKPIIDESIDVDPAEESFGTINDTVLIKVNKEKDNKLETSSSASTPRTSRSFRGADISNIQTATSTDPPKPIEAEEEIFEDGLSSITADEYVRMRLIPALAEYNSKAPTMSYGLSALTMITIALSVGSSILSTFGYATLVPLVFSFSESLSSWQNHSMTGMRLLATNGAVNQLNTLLIWWDSLSMIEKRVAVNKEQLVMTTEAAIQGTLLSYSSSTTNKSSKEDSDDES